MHVEVQGEKQAEFAQRIFVYNYRLCSHYVRPAVSLAVLGEPWDRNRGHFGYERWDRQMGLRFPVVSLPNYRGRWAELDASAIQFNGLQAAISDSLARSPVAERARLFRSVLEKNWFAAFFAVRATSARC